MGGIIEEGWVERGEDEREGEDERGSEDICRVADDLGADEGRRVVSRGNASLLDRLPRPVLQLRQAIESFSEDSSLRDEG